MDNSAVRNKWMDREALENYRHAMRICCMNALHVCSDEALSELCYDLDISRNGDARVYEHLLGGQCMVITSEPGGGKSYLMWLLLRDYLEDCRDDSDRLPVFLDGRDCGIVWDSIEKGIVRALNINFEYACHFFARVLRTYESIIQTHFDNIYRLFDGYSIDDTGKVCIRGNMNLRQRTLSVCMYNGSAEAKTLEAVVSGGRGIYRIEDKTGVSFDFEEHMIRNRREYCYDLDLLTLGPDTAREIAVDMIRDQTMRAMDRKNIFDGHVDVLLAEYTESKLRRLRSKRWTGNSESILTLYTGDYDRIIHRLEQLSVTNIEINVCASLTALIRSRVDDVTELLDIRPDLPQTDLMLKQGRHSDRSEAAYSDRQLLKKIQRIWTLSDDAIRRITTEIVPALSAVRQSARKIGWVCRGDGFSGIRYIEVKTDEGEDISPILEFREDADRIGASGDLASTADLHGTGQLQRLGKCESDVLRERTSILQRYFGDYVFHSIIYREVKRDFERLFGRR